MNKVSFHFFQLVNFRIIIRINTKLFAYLVSILLLTCCNQQHADESIGSTTEHINSSNITAKVTSDNDSNPELTSAIANKSEYHEFDLYTLPHEWIRLTEADSGKVIFKSCDEGNKLISIMPKEDNFELLIHGQQEDSKYLITKALILDSTNIQLTVQLSTDSESENFNLKWLDITKGLIIWETTYLPGYEPTKEIFVSNEFKSEFIEIEQPCIECWTQEECDQFALQGN